MISLKIKKKKKNFFTFSSDAPSYSIRHSNINNVYSLFPHHQFSLSCVMLWNSLPLSWSSMSSHSLFKSSSKNIFIIPSHFLFSSLPYIFILCIFSSSYWIFFFTNNKLWILFTMSITRQVLICNLSLFFLSILLTFYIIFFRVYFLASFI